MQERDIANIEADVVVASYALLGEHKAGQRAEACGCGGCKGQYSEAAERLDWATGMGEFTDQIFKVKAGDKIFFRKQKEIEEEIG